MLKADRDWRPDFEQALGETFGEFVCPPVPFEDASPHECCEVVWSAIGYDLTPTHLASIDDIQIGILARKFGAYFECESPGVVQIKNAIAHIMARWPVGSLDDSLSAD